MMEYGCSSCMKTTGVRPGPVQRALAIKQDAMWSATAQALSTERRLSNKGVRRGALFQHSWPKMAISERQAASTVLAIFDFDDTLFRTPQRPDWWPFQNYAAMMDSLAEPVVPSVPTTEWFDEQVLARARAYTNSYGAYWTVLITFRAEPFKQRCPPPLSFLPLLHTADAQRAGSSTCSRASAWSLTRLGAARCATAAIDWAGARRDRQVMGR